MLYQNSLLLSLGVGLSSLAQTSHAAYTLKDNYAPQSFFSQFDFWTEADPTHGFVDYVAQSAAQGEGLIQTNSGNVYMGVDHNSTASGRGRKSVRLTSNKNYDNGLFILDASHMPTGCGTWPAFWLVGPNWPNSGEIDIIEGVNTGSQNQATLHSSSGCTIQNGGMSGSVLSTSCAVQQGSNQGCGVKDSSSKSYGPGFNANKGGVYATEVTAKAISIWFFPRGSIPADLNGNSPNPGSWGTPMAHFAGCDIQSHFKDLQIVFDTTFCGDWAGGVWGSDSQCASKASSCEAYVAGHASDFADAYWTVNALKVYTGSSDGQTSTADTNSTSGNTGNGNGNSNASGSSSPTTSHSAQHTSTRTSGAASASSSTGSPSSAEGPWAPVITPGNSVVGERPVTMSTVAAAPSSSAPYTQGNSPSWHGQGGRGRQGSNGGNGH